MWKFLKWFFGITILGSIVLSTTLSVNETHRLKELRESDPEAYLEVLKSKDDVDWMIAMKALSPEQYNQELERRIRAAKSIPVAETYKNLKAYRKLAKIAPENMQFAQKVVHYETTMEEAKARSQTCETNLKYDAYIYAKEAVKLQLKSPRTAKFGSYGQTDIELYQNCVFIVKGYIDAENGFGAMIRSQYEVRLSANQSGWTLAYVNVQ